MILKRLFSLNKNILFGILIIFFIGISTLYSASSGDFSPWANKQITFFLFFFPIFLIIPLIHIKLWYNLSYFIYFAALSLLLYVEFMGHTAMGATRWIKILGINIQPSETMKIALVLALARYFYVKDLSQIKQNKHLIIPLLMIFVPAFLIFRQPDLGTSLMLIMIGVGILFLVGVQYWKFILCGVLVLSSIPIAWNYVIRDYQKKRVEIFLNPESDPLGHGYNITQSKIAIGSGGFLGKGYLKGTQSSLSFLPEKQTDFIFTMYTEEMGFIGGLFLIMLYFFLLFSIFSIAFKSRFTYNRIVAFGLGMMLFLHVFINIGMIMGLMPVVGVPLPFMSYGGTITVSFLIAFGFILNTEVYRNEEI